METLSPKDVTQLLQAWGEGNQAALERLLPLVYDELRRLARSYLRRQSANHSLQPTALVHEAYLRMVDREPFTFTNRAQFFGLAAQVIRGILVDHARTNLAEKRGGAFQKVELDDALGVSQGKDVDLIALDDALQGLAAFDPHRSRVVELRYFGGLTIEETAEFLKCSPATIKRDWSIARAWLFNEMSKTGAAEQ
ncbi:MAG: sigma-70 family RNA polymerase sigma factor [Blastocatellia bacterium]|nr:sigma-70 family RNA polymerase sigma factor [Blastocatellia bacterium]